MLKVWRDMGHIIRTAITVPTIREVDGWGTFDELYGRLHIVRTTITVTTIRKINSC